MHCFSYHVHTGIYQHIVPQTLQSIDAHKLHGIISGEETFHGFVNNFQGGPLSYDLQCQVINSLPNDSSPESRSGVSHYVYFSTGTASDTSIDGQVVSKFLPTSTRNRILYFWRLNRIKDVLDLLKDFTPQNMPQNRKRKTQPSSATRIKACRNDPEDAPEDEPMMAEEIIPISETTTPFMRFQHNLVGPAGVLKWRVHSADLDIVAMNDIDLDSGTFMRNKFIHVVRSRLLPDNDIMYICTCSMYNTISRISDDDEIPHSSMRTCCHVRFCMEQVEPLYPKIFEQTASPELAGTRVAMKIHESLVACNKSVARLDSDNNFHRFSVASRDMRSCALVTLQSNRFSCLNGKCRASKGHTRKVLHLSDAKNCEHLQALHANQNEWDKLNEHSVDQTQDSDSDGDTEGTDDQHDSARVDNQPDTNNPKVH